MPPFTDDLVPASALIPLSVSVSLEDLQLTISELQTAVALLALPRVPRPLDPDALLVAERLVRSALARLPGWLLEEAP
jgi:hypothetical protein